MGKCANKSIYHKNSRGPVKAVIQSYACDQKGRRLSGETGVEQVCFQVFPEKCDRRTISYMEGETVPKSRCIMPKGI